MSVDATKATWSLTKKQVTATEKLFLLSCADRAGETSECWPSVKRISLDTCLDRKAIISARQSVIDKGLLEYTGEMKGKTKLIPVMRLLYVNHREDDNPNSPESGTDSDLNSPESGTVKQSRIRDTEPKSLLNLKEEPNTTTTSKSSNSFCSEYKAMEMDSDGSLTKADKKEQYKKEALADPKCISKFNERFSTTDVSLEQLYEDCCDYWWQTGQMVYKSRFLPHLSKCPINNYPEKKQNKPQHQHTDVLEYQEYVGRMKSDKLLNIVNKETKILEFKEWEAQFK